MHAAGIAQPDDRQFAIRFNFDYSQVRLFVHSDDLGRVKRRFRIQLHLNLGRLFDYVIIREYESLLVHDNAGAQASLCLRSLVGRVEEPVEEIVKWICTPAAILRLSLPVNDLRGGDIHHGRFIALYDRAEGTGQRDRVRKLEGRGPARQE